MGNHACRGKCSFKKHTQNYVIILNRIYHEGHKRNSISVQSLSHSQRRKSLTRTRIPKEEQSRLELHVKTHIKSLIDYLESNQKKLPDTGKYVFKKSSRSLDPEIHIISLLIIKGLLNEFKKFNYDRDLLGQLLSEREIEALAVANEEKQQVSHKNREIDVEDIEINANSDVAAPYNSKMKGNIIEFEGFVIELLSFILDAKRNPAYEASFKYVLEVVNIYTKYHIGWIPAEKVEYIMIKALDMMNSCRDQESREHLEESLQILQIMKGLSKSPNITFSFKVKFFQYSCRTLSQLYHKTGKIETDDDKMPIQMEIKTKAFELLKTFVQSLSDFHEFEIILFPIFSFFDASRWQDHELQRDIFISLLQSMKDYTSLEQIEFFMIEKIVDYINYNENDPTATRSVAYQHNQESEVKIRVFGVLELVLKEVRESFLSFLIVDKMINCFVNNLPDKPNSSHNNQMLKTTIYNCQRNFLEKISDSSKSLVQVLNSLATQVSKKFHEHITNMFLCFEFMTFLTFTIDYVPCFPSQIFLPKGALFALLKIRNSECKSSQTIEIIEKLCELQSETEELADGRNGQRSMKLLPLEPDATYHLLASNLELLKNALEERRDIRKLALLDESRNLKLLRHFIKVNENLLERRDSVFLAFQFPFTREIIRLGLSELIIYEQQSSNEARENSGILLYLAMKYFESLSIKWNFNSINTYLSAFVQQIPSNIEKNLEKENTSKYERNEILHYFRSFGYKDSEQYAKESTEFLEFVSSQLQILLPDFPSERLNVAFEEIDPHQNLGSLNFNNDDSSSALLPIREPQLKGSRKESMAVFSQIQHTHSSKQDPKKSTLDPLQEESDISSVINSSFEKVLKETIIKQENKDINILKILNEEIF